MKKRLICTVMAVMLLCVTACRSNFEKGSALLEEQKIEEAKEAFSKSIEKEKDVADSYRGLGFCYYEEENYEEALKAFEQALNEGTKITAPLYNLAGICAMKTGAYEKAVFYFEDGQKQEGAGEELLQEMAFNLVVSYEQLGELGLAKEKLQDYVSRYPEDEKAAKELEFLNTQS